MRIKTSKNVLNKLPELKKFLKFDNDAQVLKFAINFTLNDEKALLESVVEDGFEIDTTILFGEEVNYYNFLIDYKFGSSKDKHIYSMMIEYGILKMEYYVKMSKYNYTSFIKKIGETLCT